MILVYVDFMGSDEEIPLYKKYLKKLKISAKVTDEPIQNMVVSGFTHVFMDYGGLNLPGNSLFEMANNVLDELVEEHSSIQFIIISVFGKEYYEHDLKNIEAPNLRFMKRFTDEKELQKILES